MAKTEKKTNQVDLLGVYQYLSRELQQAKDALMTEVRMASAQIGSLHGDLKDTSDKSMMAVSQEIRFSYKQNQTIYDGLASMLTKEVGERLNSIEAMLGDLEKLQQLVESLNELKYGYMNMQSVCDATQAMVANEVNPKLDSVTMAIANEVNPKLDALTGFVSNEINALLLLFVCSWRVCQHYKWRVVNNVCCQLVTTCTLSHWVVVDWTEVLF